jgi:hypothetical protein
MNREEARIVRKVYEFVHYVLKFIHFCVLNQCKNRLYINQYGLFMYLNMPDSKELNICIRFLEN